jgi:hypothetical protein
MMQTDVKSDSRTVEIYYGDKCNRVCKKYVCMRPNRSIVWYVFSYKS